MHVMRDTEAWLSWLEHTVHIREVTGSSPVASTIFVVRKSYNRQKAQDIAYLVLFCYYILCFCR